MKKKILWFICFTMIILSLTGCGKVKNSDNNTKNNTNNEKTEDVSKAKYESFYFKLFESFKDNDVNGNVAYIVGYNKPIIVSKNKKIYTYNSTNYDYFIDLGNEYKSVVDKATSENVLLQKKDNTYTIYDVSKKEKVDFKAENLVAATVITSGSGELYPQYYTIKDGGLYDSKISKSEDLNINEKKVNLDLKSYGAASQIVSLDNVNFVKKVDTDLMYITTSDGNVFSTKADAYEKTDGTVALKIAGHLNNGQLSNVDKIYPNVSAYNASVPYTLKNDDNNIYVMKGIINTEQVAIALPEGYKKTDIKNAYLSMNSMLLELNDGNMYYSSSASSASKFEAREDLSKINKAKHIKGIGNISSDLIALCDDGYIYTIR